MAAMRIVVLSLVVCVIACKREPDAKPNAGTASPASGATPGTRDAAVPALAARDAGGTAAAANARLPIKAAKLELVGSATVKALELSENGEVKVGDKLIGTLSPDGTFTRDGKVIAAIGEDGELLLEGKPADPPIRIDPEGDVFLDGELMMTIGDDGKISTVDKDGVITENVLALLEGPPEGRRAVAMLLVLVTTSGKRSDPPPSTSGRAPEPSP
jgi:hypothetical protein